MAHYGTADEAFGSEDPLVRQLLRAVRRSTRHGLDTVPPATTAVSATAEKPPGSAGAGGLARTPGGASVEPEHGEQFDAIGDATCPRRDDLRGFVVLVCETDFVGGL